ncbi:hypothetical protein FHS11_001065 [Mucilaginibacter gotjawali]|uniref:Uncharacterized protein n=1 Tax=Mucilaginibacter gotjawali TaxID=1550579 RepID=A0A839S9I5_9SPHI|nr:hypothetical protein [Mucilaginibacter gotjawali]
MESGNVSTNTLMSAQEGRVIKVSGISKNYTPG